MKQIITNVLLVLLLGISITSFSQTKRSAGKEYKKLAYKKSADMYKALYDKGDDSYEVISRIADSYYFNTDTKNSEKWYATLSKKYPNNLKQEHLFRYVQSLQGNKKYDEANRNMKNISSVEGGQLASDLLATPNYFTKFENPKYNFNSFDNLDINTKYSDFGGFEYNDKLYFASTKPGVYKGIYQWNEQPFLNLYSGPINNDEKAERIENITVKSSKLLDEPIRTKFHESNAVITKDGKTMYFTRDNYHQGKKRRSSDRRVKLKLFRANLVNGKWANILELPFNSNQYSVGHPALSPDENILYFASDKPGGYGATDIYKVAIKENNTYGAVTNLGKTINTPEREMFPYVSVDNVLYFASDGHLGLGGLDIFESEITDGKFGKVGNMQKPFSSNLDDFAFYINLENKRGFVSSNREGGKGDDDIYSFVLTKTKRRSDYNCNKTITGVVTNLKTGEILPEATVAITDDKGNLITELKSNEKGSFSFPINCLSEVYKLNGSKVSFKNDSEQVVSEELKADDIIKLELDPIIKVVPVVSNDIVIHPIYFNFDKSGIREGDSRPDLDEVISVMKSHPDMVIRIESHTDSRATNSYNKRLSQRRANSTRKYMLSHGITPSRIAGAIGYGESQLLNGCDDNSQCTEEEHQLNRRSYFVIIKGGEGIRIDNTPPRIIDRKPGF